MQTPKELGEGNASEIEVENPKSGKELIAKAKEYINTPYKYEFADFNAASLVLQNLENIYNDMIENNGLQYKILLNDMLAESK